MTQDRINVTQRKAQEADRDKERERQLTVERDDTQWLMSTIQGRRFVWAQLSDAGVFRTSFTGNSETFFKEGQRDIGLRLLGKIMRHTPEAFSTMMAENNNG